MTDSATELGQMLGNLAKGQSDLQSNAFGDEGEGLLNLSTNESLVMTGTLTATAYYYSATSFVIDHPVYGNINSATLAMDGDYDTVGAPAFPWTWGHTWGGYRSALLYSTSF